MKTSEQLKIEKSLNQLPLCVDDAEKMRQIIEEAFLMGYPPQVIEALVGVTAELKQDMVLLRHQTRKFAGHMASIVDSDVEQMTADDFEKALDSCGEVLSSDEGAHQAQRSFWDKYDAQDPEFLARFFAVGIIAQLKIMPVFKSGELDSQGLAHKGKFEGEDEAAQPDNP
ncbi:MAG: hypothetical protein K1X67_00355 [Fimbriimonadaceae bacterium]|nr:hypothetical protein [Fimbriimonadaceae bacterium]